MDKKQKKERKLPKLTKKSLRFLLLACLLVLFASVSVIYAYDVLGIPSDAVNEDETDTVTEQFQHTASPNATIKYRTVGKRIKTDKGDWRITSWTSERTDADSNGDYNETTTMDTFELLNLLLERHSRTELAGGIESHMTPIYGVVKDGVLLPGEYESPEAISAQANWSKGALEAFKDSFDPEKTKMYLKFDTVNVTIRFVDIDTGTEIGGFTGTISPSGIIFKGETASVSWSGSNPEYTYVKEGWGDGSTGAKKLTGDDTYTVYFQKNAPTPIPVPSIVTPIPTPVGGTDTGKQYMVMTVCVPEEGGTATGDGLYNPGDSVSVSGFPNDGYELDYMLRASTNEKTGSFIMPEHNEVVVVYFKKKTEVTPEPTAKPTATPTPSPTPAPHYTTYTNEQNFYYSTTSGHSIGEVYSYTNLAGKTGTFSGDILANIAEQYKIGRPITYTVGTDTKGNEWYCILQDITYTKVLLYTTDREGNKIPYQTTTVTEEMATYVHPRKYNGYYVDSSQVAYISELTFPKEVTVEGKKYKTYSIGGGGEYYFSTTNSPYFGQLKGSWKQGSHNGSSLREFSYKLGVIGNGTVTSKDYGSSSLDADNHGNIYYSAANYYVYNTTLSSITIPDTVRVILPYAFENCQALVYINGGDGVQEIGAYAFKAAEIPEFKHSTLQRYSKNGADDSYYTCMYYYDDAYAKAGDVYPEKMLKFKEYLVLQPYMPFPVLSVLVTLGESSFEGRYNLTEVELGSTVTTIGANTFKDCTLNRIEIPYKNTVVLGDQKTLGTKGALAESLTVIETTYNDPAKAMYYGFKYHMYYRVKAGILVYYHSNGGTPQTAQERSEMEYLPYTFTKMLVTDESGYDATVVWLGTDGKLYSGKTTYNKTAGGYVLKAAVCESACEYEFVDLKPLAEELKESHDISLFQAETAEGSIFLFLYSETTGLYNFGNTMDFASEMQEIHGVVYYTSGYSDTTTGRPGAIKYRPNLTLYYTGSDRNLYKFVNGGIAADTVLPCIPKDVCYYTKYNATYTTGMLGENGSLYAKTAFGEAWTEVMQFTYSASSRNFTPVDLTDAEFYTTYSGSGAGNFILYAPVPDTYYVATKGSCYVNSGYQLYYYLEVMGEEEARTYKKINPTASSYSSFDMYDHKTPLRGTMHTFMNWDWTYNENGDYVPKLGHPFSVDNALAVTVSSIKETDYYSADMWFTTYSLNSENQIVREVVGFSGMASSSDHSGSLPSCSELLADGRKFEKVAVLSYETPASYTREYSYSYTSQVGDGERTLTDYNSIFGTGAVVKIFALDEEGHLWYGYFDDRETNKSRYSRNASYGYSKWDMSVPLGPTDLHQVSDKVYLDMLYKELVEVQSLGSHTFDVNGDSKTEVGEGLHNDGYQYVHTNNLFLLDANYDVYCVKDTKYTYTDVDCICDGGTQSIAYNCENSSALTYVPYKADVLEFLNFPYIWMDDEEEPLQTLASPQLIYDIFPGVIFRTVVQNNKWFTKEGNLFLNWNGSADGTGTTYNVGDVFELGTMDSSWKSSLTTMESMNFYAQWDDSIDPADLKYIVYDANGGSGTMDSTHIPKSGSVTLSPNAFVRSGYTFLGWSRDKKAVSPSYTDRQTIAAPADSITLYAVWKPYKYTLQFASDVFEIQPADIFLSRELAFGDTFILPAALDDKTCTVTYDLNTSTQSTKATAVLSGNKTATVTMEFYRWKLYRGRTYLTKQYKAEAEVSGLTNTDNDVLTFYPRWEGERPLVLPAATMDGYYLAGWMDAREESHATQLIYMEPEESEYLATFTPKKTETLYALWQPNTYRILFHPECVTGAGTLEPDDSGTEKLAVTFDAEVSDTVSIPVLNHYVFKGYYAERDASGNVAGQQYFDENGVWCLDADKDGTPDTYTTVGNLELYACWVPDKEIRYEPNYVPLDADCREAWSEFVETEEEYWILAENEFTRTGYQFAGWNTAADGSGTAYADKASVATADIDGVVPFYAQWKPNEYTVQYAPDGIEEAPVIPEPGPEDIWEYDEEYTISGQPFEKFDLVSYDLNRADKSTAPEMVTELKHMHTKSVYRFVGWQLYEKTASGYSRLSDLFTEGETVINLTAEQGKAYVLFPVWKEVPDGVTLPVAKCKGYTFHGWTETQTADSMLEGSVLASPYITKRTAGGTYSLVDGHKVFHTTLYAYWTPKQYEVILDDRGATSTGHTERVVMTFDEYGPDIIVPEKTGYTFQGYYTGIRGAGTKYYDAAGTCVKPWTEDNVYVLYACWIQDEVKLPDIGDRTPPEELPETDVEGSVGRTDGKGLLYADDYNPATDALTDLQPYLAYDTPGSEGAIPGTEALAFRAKMGSWMLSYKFHRYSGTDYVRVYVAVPYRTQYEKSDSEKLVISPVQTKTYSFMVPKAWSYWEVLEGGMYYPDRVEVYNDALKKGTITIKVDREGDNAVKTPEYSVTNHGEKENHVFWKDYDTDGTPVLYIILSDIEYIISNVPDTLPDISSHLKIVCENAAWKDERQASVKSDRFAFNGEVLLSDELNTDGSGSALQEGKLPQDGETVEFTSYQQTYQSGMELDEYKPNDTYGTTALITYVGDESNVGAETTKEVELTDVNAVKIHTPVACEGVAVDGIEDGVITLRDALNFFTLRIDNTGTHRMSLGYGTKDFAFALSGKSNVAEQDGSYLNQVKFPFDVYVDVGNNSLKEDGSYDTTGDYYFTAGTWLTMGMEEQRFYVPVTQKNGTYQLEFRTIAINCPGNTEGEYNTTGVVQNNANVIASNYVAADVIEIKIKSYLKDFVITGTNDPTALLQLQAGYQALTLKKGYEFSYQVLTQGEFYGEKSEIEVTPTYFWISADETKRLEVELYHMVTLPDGEWKECYAWEDEPLLKQFTNWNVILQRWGGTGFVPAEVLCIAKDTKYGYCEICHKRRYVTGEDMECVACGTSLQKLQVFKFDEYASKQTITGKEEFFKQSGYLVIHFDIRVKSEEEIWYEFTEWNRTKLAKDALAAGWNYAPGDVIRYDLSKSISDDYEVGGVE